MTRLSLDSLAGLSQAIERPAYDPRAVSIGHVHLGPGAFFRAHVASYVDACLVDDSSRAISAVALRSSALRDALAPQDGLYTLAILDAAPRFRVIGALRELLTAADDRDAVVRRLANPATRVVTLTVTEKGYCLRPGGTLHTTHPDIVADLAGTPTSAIGWIVAGLAARRAAGLAPFVTISCDNLSGNGDKLRGAVIALAECRDPGLAAWIEANALFPATMVDSITPATDDRLRDAVRRALGLEDAWPVQREPFAQWVIEGLPGVPVFPGATVGAHVAPYESAKLRLLNGAHSALAYLGLLRGHATVAGAMQDAPLAAFIEALMHDTVATLALPAGFDAPAYIAQIITRFRNPAIVHALTQIAQDGTQKLPYRLVDTAAALIEAGRLASRPLTAIAAWVAFIEQQAAAGTPILDPLAMQLERLARADPARVLDLPIFARLGGARADILAIKARLQAGSFP